MYRPPPSYGGDWNAPQQPRFASMRNPSPFMGGPGPAPGMTSPTITQRPSPYGSMGFPQQAPAPAGFYVPPPGFSPVGAPSGGFIEPQPRGYGSLRAVSPLLPAQSYGGPPMISPQPSVGYAPQAFPSAQPAYGTVPARNPSPMRRVPPPPMPMYEQPQQVPATVSAPMPAPGQTIVLSSRGGTLRTASALTGMGELPPMTISDPALTTAPVPTRTIVRPAQPTGRGGPSPARGLVSAPPLTPATTTVTTIPPLQLTPRDEGAFYGARQASTSSLPHLQRGVPAASVVEPIMAAARDDTTDVTESDFSRMRTESYNVRLEFTRMQLEAMQAVWALEAAEVRPMEPLTTVVSPRRAAPPPVKTATPPSPKTAAGVAHSVVPPLSLAGSGNQPASSTAAAPTSGLIRPAPTTTSPRRIEPVVVSANSSRDASRESLSRGDSASRLTGYSTSAASNAPQPAAPLPDNSLGGQASAVARAKHRYASTGTAPAPAATATAATTAPSSHTAAAAQASNTLTPQRPPVDATNVVPLRLPLRQSPREHYNPTAPATATSVPVKPLTSGSSSSPVEPAPEPARAQPVVQATTTTTPVVSGSAAATRRTTTEPAKASSVAAAPSTATTASVTRAEAPAARGSSDRGVGVASNSTTPASSASSSPRDKEKKEAAARVAAPVPGVLENGAASTVSSLEASRSSMDAAAVAPLAARVVEGGDGPKPAIIEVGHLKIRHGVAGEAPRVFTSVMGVPRKHNGPDPALLLNRKLVIGDQCLHSAFSKTGSLELSWFRRKGVVGWSRLANAFLEEMERLDANTEISLYRAREYQQPTILVEPLTQDRAAREEMVKTLFEKLDAPALYLGKAPVLSLYATGRTTGLAIDLGHESTQAVAVYEGVPIAHSIAGVPLGGLVVAERLGSMIEQEGGYKKVFARTGVLNALKEAVCTVAAGPEVEPPKAGIDYQLPDGEIITVGRPAYKAAEVLFDVNLAFDEGRLNRSEAVGLSRGVGSLPQMAVSKCDSTLVPTLLENVVLTNGGAAFRGMEARIRREIQDTLRHRNAYVSAPEDPANAAWFGASLLSNLTTFDSMCVTLDQYNEEGAALVHRRFF